MPDIAKKDKWTPAELEERNQYLMSRAIEIWPVPTTTYKPEEKQLDSYTLDDDATLSGRLIARFRYKNTEQPVSSWVEMYNSVLRIIYVEDKSIITKLTVSKEEGVASYFSLSSADFRSSEEIAEGIFASTNTGTQTKIMILNKLFLLYQINPSDLVFYLRDENESAGEEAGTRDELRRRYWTFALAHIKADHGEKGSFSNVNPSKENQINGFFGISGFSLACVANYDSAGVELYLGKSKMEKTKQYSTPCLRTKMPLKLLWAYPSRGTVAMT